MSKKSLSERDICTQFVVPSIASAGWDLQHQVREEVAFTKGRILVQGRVVRRGDAKRADYVLYFKANLPVAVVEAKDNNHTVGAGMQQALDYAETLDVPFAFSTNGDAFLVHDRTDQTGAVEREIALDDFPSPAELWSRYCLWKGLADQASGLISQDYYVDATGKAPRYYQRIAINRAVEAIARGQSRLLLVMATGTGKTYTAFQIIWRLWKAKRMKRILFLADRNILIDQARLNDFKPFGSAMTKISHRAVDKSFEIYLALYQAVSGTEERANIYREFSSDFFDLVIVDECHRGSAAEDSAWRDILDYFGSATHLGLTATPKETRSISNIDYFGEPVYVYSLKQGIADGFLAPYKVIRVDIDRDVLGWRPEKYQTDKYGQAIEDRIYNQRDIDRALVLEQRTTLVAQKVSDYLKATGRFAKTIVFCEDVDHAERMRQALVNANGDLAAANHRYVMRITGDNDEGKAELDNFVDPQSVYPVIATTSRLMSTGVDAQTCKLIVLDRRIESITEFKQIIGRGTRVNEQYGKYFFTIMDFKRATEHFADPDFDGDPVKVYEPGPSDPIAPADDDGDGTVVLSGGQATRFGSDGSATELTSARVQYVVDDVPVTILAERVQYLNPEGALITESLRDYTRRRVATQFASLGAFLTHWSQAERKEAIIQELERRGVFLDALAAEVGRDYDAFDLICHVAFGQPPLTRAERAANVRKRDYFARYGADARAVLNALLDKYAEEGIADIESLEVLRVQPLTAFGTPLEIISRFGSRDSYIAAIRQLENAIYADAA